jgi:hypothetical protein
MPVENNFEGLRESPVVGQIDVADQINQNKDTGTSELSPISLVLKLLCRSESPGKLVRHQASGSHSHSS